MSCFDRTFAFYAGESKRLAIRVSSKSGDCIEPIGISAPMVAASLTFQSILFIALQKFGNTGNNFKVEFVGGATAGSEVVTITDLPLKGKLISVRIATGVSTAAQVLSKLQAHAQYGSFFTAATSTPATTQVVQAVAPFVGGTGDMVVVDLSANPNSIILDQFTSPAVVVADGPLSKIYVDLTEVETNQMTSGSLVVTITKNGKSTIHVVEGGIQKLTPRSC